MIRRRTYKIKASALRIGMILMTVYFLSGCTLSERILASNDSESQAWELITDSANRTEVVLCVDPSDEALIDWLKDDFAERMKVNYNVTVTVLVQSIAKTYEKLGDDQLNERETGQFDVVFLNGDTFDIAMKNQYLYGPFEDQVPNAVSYLNASDLEMQYDEARAINGYELPYAKTQLYMIYDENYFYDIPESNEALLALFKSFKGQFTYPDPRTSDVGEAFIVSLMLPYLDIEKLNTGELDDAALLEAVTPVLDALKALKPYQYGEGTSFPQTAAAMDQLYQNGDLVFSMSLVNNYATDQLRAYEYPEESNVFVMPEGSTGLTDYVGIANNAPNKSGAIVVINELLSAASQADIYNPKFLGKLPVYDLTTTPDEAFTDLKSVKLKSTTLSYSELLDMRFPEIAPGMRQKMVNLWTAHVLNDTTGE
ncbi:ABC transporter substrate-binding protein [Fusibacter paucivorans]|uniref:ABC transporter substrate-binding protein n=1 Tax=Fusibacter paucivorans TaxID=76009 RepID=A0ABS5PRQ0_9FIRM|nr:ABC transporter substrate-binding protein [Fusibacter paucivorans]